MKDLEYNKVLAYQGVAGANQHLVCKTYFPKATYKPYQTFEEVFAAVENEEVGLGLVPIENSCSGRVSEIHNLLRKTELYIVGEYFLDIRHHLAAVKGTKIEDVKMVISHPQALMQCTDNIKKHNLERMSYLNTALAAQYVKDKQDTSVAALCSDLAAEVNGLEILKEDFQDQIGNKTIFIVIARQMSYLEEKSKKKITTLLYDTRNIPGGIYKTLGGFATNNVNIIKLESYIPGGVSNEAQFFISFEGAPDDDNVKLALEELGFFSKKIKLLGVYDSANERNSSKN